MLLVSESAPCDYIQQQTRTLLSVKIEQNFSTDTKRLHLARGLLKNNTISYKIVENKKLRPGVMTYYAAYKGYNKFWFFYPILPKLVREYRNGVIEFRFEKPKKNRKNKGDYEKRSVKTEKRRNRKKKTDHYRCLTATVIIEVPRGHVWEEITVEKPEEEEKSEKLKGTTTEYSGSLYLERISVKKLDIEGISGNVDLKGIKTNDLMINGKFNSINITDIDTEFSSLSLAKIDIVNRGTGVINLINAKNAGSIKIESNGVVNSKDVTMGKVEDKMIISTKKDVKVGIKRGSVVIDGDKVKLYLPDNLRATWDVKGKKSFYIPGTRYSRRSYDRGTINCPYETSCGGTHLVVDAKSTEFRRTRDQK